MATIQLTTQEFKEKIFDYTLHPQSSFRYEGSLPAIVDFYATWCGPCKALSPILEELATEYDGKLLVYKVDVDKNPELSRLFNIRSIPTLLFLPTNGGQPSLSTGVMPKTQLKERAEQML